MGSQRFHDSLPKTTVEIDPKTIQILNVIDRGSYGTVKTAFWDDKEVAVKVFETQGEIEAFRTEVEVLGSVSHKNIIHLYGMSVGVQCLIVMELATQGSLYNLLHKRIDIGYGKEHMIVWWTEITEAISYLHNRSPKPIIHRDLKSSNILLKDDHIKICDFGTACDIHTLMSNAKGTVAWMAPEVITTTDYNEKCDVYSFGIVMWEVLMRRVPFKGLNSFQVMQTVDRKKRPPLPKTVPTSIRTMIQLCWSHDPTSRPSFTSLCKLLNKIWDSISDLELEAQPPAPNPAPTTPEAGPSRAGNIGQPSPPRFPITPGSCSPSPTVATYPPVGQSTPKLKDDEDALIRPYRHIQTNVESCDIHKQHLQTYEELKMLRIHLNRKKGVIKSLKDKYRDLQNQSQGLESSNEGKQLRLSILRSETESLNQQLNHILDNP
ncbi:mitogen-activated protein kinase kinase kinase 7-like [Bolinopsis microptera]|uniref:mitogen-activated protein kinase kinase kinase 7-like n=1 Tax=Bolinopsis microptera TaxID=2820187 RepID=UPI003078F1F5